MQKSLSCSASFLQCWKSNVCRLRTFPYAARIPVAAYCEDSTHRHPSSPSQSSHAHTVTLPSHDNGKTPHIMLSRFRVVLERENGEKIKERLMLTLKCCRSFIICDTPQERVKLAERVLHLSIQEGVRPDVNVFNLLLQVHGWNKEPVVPSEFLKRMKSYDCQPNLTTLHGLVEAYYERGNRAGGKKMVDYLEARGLPITSQVHAAMVTGHAKAGNLDEAEALVDSFNGESVYLTAVGNSLLVAYAERGLMDKMEETLLKIREHDGFYSAFRFREILDCLSRHGHGKHIQKLLTTAAFRHFHDPKGLVLVCHSCIIRGDYGSAMAIFKVLSDHILPCESMVAGLVRCGIMSGHSLAKILLDFGEFKIQNFQEGGSLLDVVHFNEIVCNQVVTLGLHYPDMKKGNVIPRKGDLRPHPLGDERWCHEAQQSLMLLQKDKVLMLWNFLPLLARYCSNADIAGALELVEVMAKSGVLLVNNCSIVKDYIRGTFYNADTNVQAVVMKELAMETCDQKFLKQLALFLLLKGDNENLISLIKKIEDKTFWKREEMRRFLVHHVKNDHQDLDQFAAGLLKNGVPASVFKNMLYKRLQVNLPMIKALMKLGVDMNVVINYLAKTTIHWFYHDQFFSSTLKTLWSAIEITNTWPLKNDLKILYKISRINQLKISKVTKERIEELVGISEDNEDMDLLNIQMMAHLNQKHFNEALKIFYQILALENSKSIAITVWRKLVVAAYDRDPTLGEDLLRKMEAAGCSDVVTMTGVLFSLVRKHGDYKRAEEVLNSMDRLHQVHKGYHIILPLWGELGMLDKIEAAKKDSRNAHPAAEAKVLALLQKDQLEEAKQEFAATAPMYHMYLRLLMKLIVKKDLPVAEWREVCHDRVPFDTVLLFTYLDLDMNSRARAISATLTHLDDYELAYRYSMPQARTYRKFLESKTARRYGQMEGKKWEVLCEDEVPINVDIDELQERLEEIPGSEVDAARDPSQVEENSSAVTV